MFDFIASQNIEHLRKAVVDLTATAATNAQMLVEKDVCTEEEWTATKARVLAHMDQMGAAHREEKLAKLEAMSPVARAMYEAVGLDLSKPEE